MSGELLAFRSGPFNIRLHTDHSGLFGLFQNLYRPIPRIDHSINKVIFHYQLEVLRPRSLRRFVRPQVEMMVDGIRPFEPYPYQHYMPLFEWGLNWSIAMTAHQYLLLHSAALEYKSVGCIFPALPGSGKSTLCAALAYNNWRLLSDEFGVYSYSLRKLLPMPRAIGLKNESISIIRAYLPEATIGPSFSNTRKGTVAHVAPPRSSLEQQHVPVEPRLIIFPQYDPTTTCRLTPIPKSVAFTKLSNNSFNYQISMRRGFRAMSHLIQHCDAYQLQYHSLDEGIAALEQLVNEKYL